MSAGGQKDLHEDLDTAFMTIGSTAARDALTRVLRALTGPDTCEGVEIRSSVRRWLDLNRFDILGPKGETK